MTDLERYGHCTLRDDHCVTCGDIAVPVHVIRLTDGGAALCEDRTGRRETIATEFTPDARQGDVLLVHGGVAIGVVRQNDRVSGRTADEDVPVRIASEEDNEHEREGASA